MRRRRRVRVVLALAATIVAVVVLRCCRRTAAAPSSSRAVALVPLVALGWWALHPPPPWSPPAGLRVSFLDVGQGDGILLETPRGRDARRCRPAGGARRPAAPPDGAAPLAALVVSHAHRDHVGGGAGRAALARGRRGDRPAAARTGPRRAGAAATARERGVPLVPARVGRTYALGRLRLRVLWPDHAGSPDENPHLHGAVVLASYGAIDLLLTGDSESEVTRALPLRPVEVLKVAHHGSSDPGLADELRVLRPRVAVISVGAHNDYGHPRADTLAALHARAGPRASTAPTRAAASCSSPTGAR